MKRELEKKYCSPLTFHAFSNRSYYKSRIPSLSKHYKGVNHDLIATASLKTILELESKQLEKERRLKGAESLSSEIFDKNLPKWLAKLNIIILPPSSDKTIILFNSIIEAWKSCEQETGIKLTCEEFPFFDSFLRKLTLCLPRYGERIYDADYYDRDSLLYCGLCDDRIAGRRPMSLKQANDHIESNHKLEIWKIGMLRKLPPGQPVTDGHCTRCHVALLVVADHGETKTGVRCIYCKKKWCFSCMDKRIWHGVDERSGIFYLG